MSYNTISELRELLGKATAYPWDLDGLEIYSDGIQVASYIYSKHDAALIVAMRNALPEILDRLEELEGIYHE